MEKSLYELVTDLCEKHVDKSKCISKNINIQSIIKRLRVKAYEILLKKKSGTLDCNGLEGVTDPICHLLSWQYTLKYCYDQPDRAEELGVFIKDLDKNQILDDSVVRNVILFLVYLRGSRCQTEDTDLKYNIFDRVTLKHKVSSDSSALPYDIYPEYKFHFPDELLPVDKKSYTTFSQECFEQIPAIRSNTNLSKTEDVLGYSCDFQFAPLSQPSSTTQLVTLTDIERKNSSSLTGKSSGDENIWEIVSKLPVENYRNWESLDNFEPPRELPFESESGVRSLRLLEEISDSYHFLRNDKTIFGNIRLISMIDFIKSVKYMLVGMASKEFLVNENNLFDLCSDVRVEGTSASTLQSYCKDLLCCGSCYRALNQLCSTYPLASSEKNGYIYKEMYESVKRYLAFYRMTALSLPDTSSLSSAQAHMHKLKGQITTLARICRVTEAREARINGVQLLNLMYREIMETADKNLALILYSMFYPCCQIYFSRFLQRWLFEGILIDPYEEFMVQSKIDYVQSRARTYWTRSFSLRLNAIPDFLVDLKNSILHCGKTMNLLKLCNPNASLHAHIMSRKVPLISCCLTPEHGNNLRQEIDRYYIEMASLCGPRISLYHKLRERYEENLVFLSLVEKKRTLTLQKIELIKQREAEEKARKKRKIFDDLRKQMAEAAEIKKKLKEDELKKDLMIAEQNAQIEEMRSKLVKEETKLLIKYYHNLISTVDKRRDSIKLRKIIEQQSILNTSEPNENDTTLDKEDSEKSLQIDNKTSLEEEQTQIIPQIVENDDIVNANIEKSPDKIKFNNEINDTFTEAKRNRAKIMNLEFDVKIKQEPTLQIPKPIESNANLTEAQRNKRRVLSSEFDLYRTRDNLSDRSEISETKSTISLASPGHEDVMNTIHRHEIELNSINETDDDFKSCNSEINMDTVISDVYIEANTVSMTNIETNTVSMTNNDVIPMSVDSTPISELPTPLTLRTDLMTDSYFKQDSALLTAASHYTDDGFQFPIANLKSTVYEHTSKLLFANKKILSINGGVANTHTFPAMRLSKLEVAQIKNGNLKLLLHESVYIPLEAQIKLVNDEILKYFINEQNFFSHLHSLRCYYFLLDGEFGRYITEGLFYKLYSASNPADLLNCRSLQLIINKAIYASSKMHENADRLSFIVKDVPNRFDLSNADVLECVSLSYRINWPLNILLPSDTIAKYDRIFKYLLKLHHVSWILQKMFQELKLSQKELMGSLQYHKLQMYRHIMTHFVQTLQNYTVGEVLQTSWEELENNMRNVHTFDQLYTVHIVYVKTIMFRCLLNKKCEPIMKVIHEIFVVILKFYNYLRTRSWVVKTGTHPNFKKMEDIFKKFEEFTCFVFRVGSKMARVGYQPHLVQMLDMLNMNDYYANKIIN